jgi:hypothetical protein
MKAESWQWNRAPSSHQDRILNVRLNLERQVYESLLVGLGIGSPVTSFRHHPSIHPPPGHLLLAGELEVLIKRALLNHSYIHLGARMHGFGACVHIDSSRLCKLLCIALIYVRR